MPRLQGGVPTGCAFQDQVNYVWTINFNKARNGMIGRTGKIMDSIRRNNKEGGLSTPRFFLPRLNNGVIGSREP